jgi:hypothetical protein
VAPDVIERFKRPADDPSPTADNDEFSLEVGPAVVFEVRAEKGGRVVMVSLALGSLVSFVRSRSFVDVRANDVVFANAEVRAERLFQAATNGELRFQEFADADAAGDGDGRLSPAEAKAAGPADVDACYTAEESEGSDEGPTEADGESPCASLLDRIASRAGRVLIY